MPAQMPVRFLLRVVNTGLFEKRRDKELEKMLMWADLKRNGDRHHDRFSFHCSFQSPSTDEYAVESDVHCNSVYSIRNTKRPGARANVNRLIFAIALCISRVVWNARGPSTHGWRPVVESDLFLPKKKENTPRPFRFVTRAGRWSPAQTLFALSSLSYKTSLIRCRAVHTRGFRVRSLLHGSRAVPRLRYCNAR